MHISFHVPLRLSLLAATCWISTVAVAEPLPLRIEAREAIIDEQAANIQYQGEVVITQGNEIRLEADQVNVELDAEGALQTLRMRGAPVVLNFYGDRNVTGYGARVDYHLNTRIVNLRDAARLVEGSRQLSGAHIEYHLDAKTINARSTGDSNASRRVEMIYQVQP